MSLLGRFLAARSDPISLEAFGALLAQNAGMKTRTGVAMTVNRALGISPWYSGIRYLVDQMAFLPVKTFRDVPDGRTVRAAPAWMAQPDRHQPWPAWVEFQLMSLLHRGNGYSLKLRNELEQVTGLRVIHPDKVKRVGLSDDGRKLFEIEDNTGRRVPFTDREILHIPGLSYDGVLGLDPIRHHAETLGIVAAADQFAGNFYKQGNAAHGYISVPQKLTPEQARELHKEWSEFHTGLQNANSFGVLGLNAEYKTIGLDAEQTQLLQSRKWGVLETARMLRVPPHKLYDLERAIYSNIEHQNIDAVVDSIRPWCERFETWINADQSLIVPGNFIEFNLEGLLRGDTTTRYSSYESGIRAGWMLRSEPRAKENLPVIEGFDEPLEPLNMRLQSERETTKDKVEAAGSLVRAGYDPAEALKVVGLPPIKHKGLAPVTVQPEDGK